MVSSLTAVIHTLHKIGQVHICQCGMTKYRKGPQRTTEEHYTGPQRIGNHEKTAKLTTIWCKIALLCHFLLYTVFFATAALTAPFSQRPRCDASDDWDVEWNFDVHRWRGLPLHTDWLSQSAGSQLGPAACDASIDVSAWEHDSCFHKHCWSTDWPYLKLLIQYYLLLRLSYLDC